MKLPHRRWFRRRSPHGLKLWFIPRTEYPTLTPYAKREKRRRRAARKVAHESRRRNNV